MASVGTELIIKQEYRPCWVNGKKGLFHKWLTKYDLIYKSEYAKGLKKKKNGHIGEFNSENIQFCDNKFTEYDFTKNIETEEK